MSVPPSPPSGRSLWPLLITVMSLFVLGAIAAGLWWTLAGPLS